nr:ATP-dependent DNA helicase pif1-like [Neodiprion pinetum]
MDNKSTDRKQEKCFYIDGSGGTGKTFLYNALYYMLKSEKKNVACVAWTGIAAILLPYGTTAHKTFGLPLTLQKEGTIFTNATMKKKIQSIVVFIWDECSMIPKIALELIDRTLKDIMEDASPFGGKTIILGGDFGQVLPIVKRGGKQQIIEETIKYSTLWSIFEKLSLKKNMRAKEDAAKFSEWLLNIGNGEVELFVPEKEIQSNNLIDDLYPRNLPLDELTNRAILAPLNVEVNQLNTEILRRMDANIFESKSIDYATLQGIDTADAALDEEATLRYPIEYLNGLTL